MLAWIQRGTNILNCRQALTKRESFNDLPLKDAEVNRKISLVTSLLSFVFHYECKVLLLGVTEGIAE